MHVGNCTDGPADYQLSGGGQIVEPPQFTGGETFRLAKEKQNKWVITGTKTVSFTVNENVVATISDVSNADSAILVQVASSYVGVKLEEAAHEEA